VSKLESKVISCPECNSTEIIKSGKRITRKGIKQQYQCKKCGRYFRRV